MPKTEKKKILVAEDERPLAMAMQLKLSKEGFEVVNAYDGDEALAQIAKDKFDLLVLDLVMPKKDGFSVLEELKKQGKAMKIIVLSNLSQDEDIARAKSLGADDFFIKSNTPISDLVSHVKKLI